MKHREGWVWVAAGALAIVPLFGGNWEGKLFPVATGFEIASAEDVEGGYTRISGSFKIERPGCDFRGIDWIYQGVRRDVLVAVYFEEGTKERGGGVNDFGPWRVQLTQQDLLDRSNAVVFHKCPWRWWLTQTPLYP